MSEQKSDSQAPLPDRLEVVLSALKQHGIPWIEEAISAARLNEELNAIIGDMRGRVSEQESIVKSLERSLADLVNENNALRAQIASGVSGEIRTAFVDRDRAIAAQRECATKFAKLESEQLRKNMRLVELETKVKLLEKEVSVQRKRGAAVLGMLSKQGGSEPTKG